MTLRPARDSWNVGVKAEDHIKNTQSGIALPDAMSRLLTLAFSWWTLFLAHIPTRRGVMAIDVFNIATGCRNSIRSIWPIGKSYSMLMTNQP